MLGNDTSGMWASGGDASPSEGFWSSYQPDLAGGQCVHVDMEATYYYEEASWGMANCKQPMPFVCQAGGCPDGKLTRRGTGTSIKDF